MSEDVVGNVALADAPEVIEATSHAPVKLEYKKKPVYDFVKRAFDIFVSLLCLTVGLPVYLIIALAIVIDDPGNPLFIQERVGRNNKVFKMVKFRTMRMDAIMLKFNLSFTYLCHV